MTLIPAYGRDYKSAAQVKAAWENGQDFLVADFHSKYDGKPANKESCASEKSIQIRYNGQRSVCVIR